MQSMAEVVDRFAEEEPDRVWVKIPDSPCSVRDTSWSDITFRQLSRAVNVMAHWIDQHIGKAEMASNGETLAYMGGNDIRYPILILAALKTGYTSLLTSPRNSIEGHMSLMGATHCAKLIYGKELKSHALTLSAQNTKLRVVQVPDVETILDEAHPNQPYSSRANTALESHETVMILHSSGTTGLPKPIAIRAGVFDMVKDIMSKPNTSGRRYMHEGLYGTELLVAVVPFFHCYGINLLCRSIYHRGTLVLLPPAKPPSPDLVLLAMEKTKPTAIACAPSILEDINDTPGGLEALSKLDIIYFGGAPLAYSSGEQISKVTKLVNGIGSTEMYFAATYVPVDPADWEYFEWDPRAGIEMEATTNPDLAEMVLKRDPAMDHQFVFHNFPSLDEWRTRDLFERHPTKPMLWRYVGRTDDVLVLSNGEKINPVHFEKALEGHSRIKGALMVGSRRFQAGLILEPHSERPREVADTDSFIQQIWPWVDRANAKYPAYARVWRSMITLTAPDKSFVRTAKGSVMRRATYQLFEKEIDELYSGKKAPGLVVVEGTEASFPRTKDIIRNAALAVLGNAHNMADQTNLFSLGMDSLQVVELSQLIRQQIGKSIATNGGLASCSPKTIYANSTIETLALAVAGSSAPDDSRSRCSNTSREEQMSAMIHKYTRSIPFEGPLSKRSGRVVVLTGSTGSLGTYLLHRLLNLPDVGYVHCLNRSPDAAERQSCLFLARGLGHLQHHLSRITFHTADLSREWFGLAPETYARLLRNTHVLIHNAWPVNFNRALADFEPAIAGTRRCADFAAAAQHKVHVVFVSSVASVMNYAAVRGHSDLPYTGIAPDPEKNRDGDDAGTVVPEEFDTDNSLPAKQGYGESKHVAECVLAEAVRRTGIRVTALRAGQLAGPAEGEGVWNRNEWLPSLVATSKTLGKIPACLGPRHDSVDWVPVDLAAQVALDIAFSAPNPEPTETVSCFNIVNPQSTCWGELARTVQEFYAVQGRALESVSLDEWVDALAGVNASMEKDALRRYPALRLLDFFHGLRRKGTNRCTFSTHRALEHSPTMAQLRAVDETLMRKWLTVWAF